VIGDFNIGDDDVENYEENLFRKDFDDVWKVLHPTENGYTYDPTVNTLARITTRKNLSKRFDRILFKYRIQFTSK
jgi:hypothetical protein